MDTSVKNVQSRSGITPEWKGVDNKSRECKRML